MIEDILAFEKLKYNRKLSALETIDISNYSVFKDVFVGPDEIEATLYYQIIRERIEVIRRFHSITEDDAIEKVVQEYLVDHLWLLDTA